MGEQAYAYAKACGIIGKSLVGKKISRLKNIGGLSELDRLVFPAAARGLPEKELLLDLEDRILGRAVDSIISIVDCFSKPPEFLTLLVRGYEYTDLKSAIISSVEGEKTAPAHTDIGRFQTVRFDAWPDIRGMIAGTEFDFLLDKKGALYNDLGSITLQTVLDRHYYSALWKSLFSLPGRERVSTEKILADEISLRNSGWALRLRTYYWMSSDEVKLHLIYIPAKGGKGAVFHADNEGLLPGEGRGSAGAGQDKAPKMFRHSSKIVGEKKQLHLYKSKNRSLADEAVQSLDFPLDSRAAWSSWQWKEFLNPEADYHWHADPRHFQNAASRYLYDQAMRHFRLTPFSMDTIFCFIKLKQYEEDILTSDAEGLSMGMSGKDIFSVLGVDL